MMPGLCFEIRATVGKENMAKTRKTWVYAPARARKSQVPGDFQEEAQAKADKLIESVLKPEHVKQPPKDAQFNYIVDIYAKWHGSYFYFCATYACPGPHALAPSFESKFARLEYVGNRRFNLSYMRHTGKWVQIYPDLTLDECLKAVRSDPAFMP